MSDAHPTAELDDNSYAPLELKEFKSTIPEHILEKSTDQEKYILNSLSRGEQCFDWLIDATIRINDQMVRHHKRISTIEKWKENIMGKWATAVGIFVVFGGIISTFSAGYAVYDRIHAKPQQVIIHHVDGASAKGYDYPLDLPDKNDEISEGHHNHLSNTH